MITPMPDQLDRATHTGSIPGERSKTERRPYGRTGMRVSHRMLIILLLLATLAACGSDPLADLGARSRSFFDLAGTTTTQPDVPVVTTTPPTPALDLHGLEGLVWYRQDAPIWGPTGLEEFDPDQVVDIIWAQSSRRDAFVQSSPHEIAAGLPGIEFPSLVPADVTHLSGQLVFTLPGGELSDDFQAAFGFWNVEPYSQSREVGQRGVLLAGLADQAVTYGDPGSGRLACPDLSVTDALSCQPTPVGAFVGWWHVLAAGGRLVWFSGSYRYELFIRSAADAELAVLMAESLQPLAEAVP